MESLIQANAELVKKVAAEMLKVDLRFDEAAVRWLDGYIDRHRISANAELQNKLVNTLGSFFGECIRQTYGGIWSSDDEARFWFIQFSEANAVYPFDKVEKHLQNGSEDSVLSMFTAIPVIFHPELLRPR
jgi:hypothetical protein